MSRLIVPQMPHLEEANEAALPEGVEGAKAEALARSGVFGQGLQPGDRQAPQRQVAVERAGAQKPSEAAPAPREYAAPVGSELDPSPLDPASRDGPQETMIAEIKLHLARESRQEAVQPSHLPNLRHHAEQARDISRQIAEGLQGADRNRIEITLTPEELGKIRLVITAGERPMVSVHSDNADVLDLLRRNADLLERELRDTGFGGASLSFGENTRQQGRERSGMGRADLPVEAVETTLPSTPRQQAGRRLDIRI
ncbi:MAG: flagellar hook-length control protein FliK [Paracoccus sp. (in: a-proteobacteria)]|uniref:flagellar hook-length control protein FliK n=1 Tax=Paracoccus sp. TaxID=267 RepID=UPI0039E6DBA1